MNIVFQKEYRGINILLLWKASQGKFISPYWLTYRQAESLGEYVRQGEKATSIVYTATGVKKV
jgi:antirestriction protein ArdC